MLECYSNTAEKTPDLSKEQWKCLKPHVPASKGRGRPRILTNYPELLDSFSDSRMRRAKYSASVSTITRPVITPNSTSIL